MAQKRRRKKANQYDLKKLAILGITGGVLLGVAHGLVDNPGQGPQASSMMQDASGKEYGGECEGEECDNEYRTYRAPKPSSFGIKTMFPKGGKNNPNDNSLACGCKYKKSNRGPKGKWNDEVSCGCDGKKKENKENEDWASQQQGKRETIMARIFSMGKKTDSKPSRREKRRERLEAVSSAKAMTMPEKGQHKLRFKK